MRDAGNDPFTLKLDRKSKLEDSTDLFQMPRLYYMDEDFGRDSMGMKLPIFR